MSELLRRRRRETADQRLDRLIEMESQVRSCGATMEVRRLRVVGQEATGGVDDAGALRMAVGEDRLQMEETVTPMEPGTEVLLAPLFDGFDGEHQGPLLRDLPDADGEPSAVALNGPASRRTPSWSVAQDEDPSREMRVRLDQEFVEGAARQSRELGGSLMDAPLSSEAAVTNPFWSPEIKRSAMVDQVIPDSGLARPSGLPDAVPEGEVNSMAVMSPDQAVERLRLKVLRDAEEVFLSEVRRMKGAEDGGSYHSASSGEARKRGFLAEQRRTSVGYGGETLLAGARHGDLPGGNGVMGSGGGALPAGARGPRGLLGGDPAAGSNGGALPAGNQGCEGLLSGLVGGVHGNGHGGAAGAAHREGNQRGGAAMFGGGPQGHTSSPQATSHGAGSPMPPPGLGGTPMTMMSRPLGVGQPMPEALKVGDLPSLGSENASIQFGDWLVLARPVMNDIGGSASAWWNDLLAEVDALYGEWLMASPLQRLRLKPHQRALDATGQRIEMKAVNMLLQVLPEVIKKDVVATRSLTSTSILFRLYTLYQPGGGAERAGLLKSISDPKVPSNVQEIASSLRQWRRCVTVCQPCGGTADYPSRCFHFDVGDVEVCRCSWEEWWCAGDLSHCWCEARVEG